MDNNYPQVTSPNCMNKTNSLVCIVGHKNLVIKTVFNDVTLRTFYLHQVITFDQLSLIGKLMFCTY